MLPIRHLTLHCAATPEGRNVSASAIRNIGVERFGQPSYHWVVELDGTAHRLLRDDQKGAHVGGKNTGNIGICYVGGMDAGMKKAKDTRTPQQRATLLRLIKEYIAKYPGITVRGHRDWPNVRKDCPSFDVKAWLIAENVR